jgi:hypothetical protein
MSSDKSIFLSTGAGLILRQCCSEPIKLDRFWLGFSAMIRRAGQAGLEQRIKQIR